MSTLAHVYASSALAFEDHRTRLSRNIQKLSHLEDRMWTNPDSSTSRVCQLLEALRGMSTDVTGGQVHMGGIVNETRGIKIQTRWESASCHGSEELGITCSAGKQARTPLACGRHKTTVVYRTFAQPKLGLSSSGSCQFCIRGGEGGYSTCSKVVCGNCGALAMVVEI